MKKAVPKNFFQRGQSLMEVTIALGLAAIIVTALTITTILGLRNSQHSQNQVQTTKLGQEVVDRIKVMRNSNLPVCMGPGNINKYYWVDEGDPGIELIWEASFPDTVFYLSDGDCGLTDQLITDDTTNELAVNDKYTRTVRILDDEGDTTQKKFAINVSWTDSSGNHSSDLVSVLTEPLITNIPSVIIPPCDEGSGLRGDYFNDPDLRDFIATRNDPTINFRWRGDTPPIEGSNPKNFSVRWTGFVKTINAGEHSFYGLSDAGIRVWVNNTRIINEWHDQNNAETRGRIDLEGNRLYPIVVEFYDEVEGNNARVELRWSGPGIVKQIVPESNLQPANCEVPEPTPPPVAAQNGLRGEYFNTKSAAGAPMVTRVDPNINFNWGQGSPDPKINTRVWTARWVGKIVGQNTGTYRLRIEADGGVLLRLDGRELVDKKNDEGLKVFNTSNLDFVAGQEYDVVVEYYENNVDDAEMKLKWLSNEFTNGQAVVIPQQQLLAP